MKTAKFIAVVAAGVALMSGRSALADSVTWHMPSDTPYLSADDSPWAGAADGMGYFHLEDFEDGLLNTPGLEASAGFVRLPSDSTDSVDGDDGVLDGWGRDGHSYKEYNPDGASITFSFDADALGALPTLVGLVWTDGNPDATVTFEIFDACGASLGSFESVLGDGIRNGSTAADRFLGAEYLGGISAMTISASIGSLEIDHVQYGLGPVVVPLPAPLAMGLAGLGIVAVIRRRRGGK